VESSQHWADLFRDFPSDMPRKGVLIVSFNEQILFDGFLVRKGMLLVQRKTPDTVATRQVVVPYDQILGLKIVDIVEPKTFTKWGFQGTLPKK